jgi:hypothetical protein
MQVSGVNFLIPHSFNPRAPYDGDCPPYFYNGSFEPRWPLYRVFADYTSRLSLMLSGGRHVCPAAILFSGNLGQVGRMVPPEKMSETLQDAQYDCDWLPMEAFERDATLEGKQVKLHGERYRVLVVPPVEVIRYETLEKVKKFYDAGGVVLGYGFLPSRSATLGHTGAEIAALVRDIWGDKVQPGATNKNPAGGQSYFLPLDVTDIEIATILGQGAGVRPDLEVVKGQTDGWLHVLHRVKDGRDVFLVCNQNHQGAARTFTFRATAAGEPECWDAMRNEITAIPFKRLDAGRVEFTLAMEPLESVLLVFQPKPTPRPARIEPGAKPLREPIAIVREANPPAAVPTPDRNRRPLTLGPVKAADPFRGRVTLPADVDPARCRVYLEMDDLPDAAAAVRVNGAYAGGAIGRPSRLDISGCLKPGENQILVEPLAPKAARLSFYSR